MKKKEKILITTEKVLIFLTIAILIGMLAFEIFKTDSQDAREVKDNDAVNTVNQLDQDD